MEHNKRGGRKKGRSGRGFYKMDRLVVLVTFNLEKERKVGLGVVWGVDGTKNVTKKEKILDHAMRSSCGVGWGEGGINEGVGRLIYGRVFSGGGAGGRAPPRQTFLRFRGGARPPSCPPVKSGGGGRGGAEW